MLQDHCVREGAADSQESESWKALGSMGDTGKQGTLGPPESHESLEAQ